MTTILANLSTSAIVDALRQNFYDVCWELRDHWTQAVFEATDKQRRWWTSMPMAFIFNAVISTQPPTVDETGHIYETIEFFQSKGRGSFSWWLAPGLGKSGWGQQLKAHGFRFETGSPGMAVDLNSLPERVSTSRGCTIQPVEDAETLKTWLKIFMLGYGFPPDWEVPCLEFMMATLHDRNAMSYVAFVHDEPVAISTVFYRAGMAGIYSVATLSEWRRKGIGAAITLHPLLEARAYGYRVGTLQSSGMGYRVYQRLGFKEVCRMHAYEWPKQE